MENQDIIENVFRYLPLKALAKARLVCKLWEHEATKKIRKRRYMVSLSRTDEFRNFKEAMDCYVARTKNDMIYKEWSLIFDELPLEDENAQNLIKQYGTFVRRLRIRFDCHIDYPRGNLPQSFKNLLLNQMPNLEELEFCGFPETTWQQIQLFDKSVLLLPKLTSLSCFTLQGYRHANECPLYMNILKCLRPNQLKTLKINCRNYIRIIFGEAGLKPFKTNPLHARLTGLTSFSMIYPENRKYMDYKLETCQPLDCTDILVALLNTCPRLSSLHLCLTGTARSDTINIICTSLASTLVDFRLTQHCLYVNQGQLPVLPRPLPLPKLEKVVMQNPQVIVDCVSTMTNYPALKYWKTSCCITWPSTINSSTIFPNLTTLILNHNPHSCPDYETFTCDKIQILAQAFPNLKTLHLTRVNFEMFQAICTELVNLKELNVESDLYTTEAHLDCGITGFAPDTCFNLLNGGAIADSPGERREHSYIGNLRRLQLLSITGLVSQVSFCYGISDVTELTSLYVHIKSESNFSTHMAFDMDVFLKKLTKLVRMEIVEETVLSDPLFASSISFDKNQYPFLEFILNGRTL